MKKASRWAILAIAGAGAAASAYVVESGHLGSTPAPMAAARMATDSADAGRTSFAVARVPIPERMSAHPFGGWVARPEPLPTAVAAPAPAAPPAFPYKYAGTLTNGNGVTEAFLLRGAELVPIKVGELLDAAWRIDALTADRIEVTFVPASERMSLLLASLVAEPGNVAAQSASAPSVARYGQPNAAPAVTDSPPGPTRPGLIGGVAAGRAAAAAPRVGADASTAASAAASSAAASGATGAALGLQTPATGTRLGTEPPTQGSMPVGAPPGGSFPKGEAPTGKLGL